MTLTVTIITPCFDGAATIEQTIRTVLEQSYPHIEYIIMDGGSNDGTGDIVSRYRDRLCFVSERDHGQSDAINRGWRRSSGDVIAWLNADDQYLPDTVQRAVEYLDTHPEAAWVYGSLVSIDEEGKPFPSRNFPMEWDYSALREIGCFVAQPTVFLRRTVIEEFGYLDETLHYAMDWEYWLRIGQKYPGHLDRSIRAKMIRSRTTKTESGGVSRALEFERIAHQYGMNHVPRGSRSEWGTAFLESALDGLGKKSFRDVLRDFTAAGRYPAYLPRAFTKVLFRRTVSYSLEARIRRAFLGPGPNTQ